MSIKKTAKRLFAAIVALVLSVAMVTPAYAADITIDNAVNGQTYTAYKLFDVTNSGNAYAYTTENTTLKNAIEAEVGSFGLTFTETTTSGTYNVTFDEDTFDPADFAAWISSNLNRLGLTSVDTATGSNGTATISDVGTGYFFVTSSMGSLCILNTASDDVTINEKNTVPTITKKVYEDSKTSYEDNATIDVIDTIKYQLTVNTGSNTNTNSSSTGINADYVITDVLPDGITYDAAAGVSINGWTLDTDYTVNWEADENTLTITLMAAKLQTLAQNADIVITYEASADANLDVDTSKANKVTLTYNKYTANDTANVITYDINGSDEGNTFTKVDGDNEPLSGVKFVLQNSTTGEYATFDVNGYLTGWVKTQNDATKLVTDNNGHIYAYGLDADTYILTETDTLPGYNKLTNTITVTIAENGTVTYKYTNSSGSAGNSIEVVNEAGSLLPSTGGTGTTMLYVVGGALVAAAGVALVVRRRMSNEA